jgi:mono/diheme cytochrome c family protein
LTQKGNFDIFWYKTLGDTVMRQLIFIIWVVWWQMGSTIAGEWGSDDKHHGRSNEHYPKHWMAPKNEATRSNPIKKTFESISRGRTLYIRSCANCHGNDAQGDGPAATKLFPKPADLREMAGHHPDGDIAWKISHGRGVMPAWKNMLGRNQLWDLVNYIQSLSTKTEKKQKNGVH